MTEKEALRFVVGAALVWVDQNKHLDSEMAGYLVEASQLLDEETYQYWLQHPA